MIQTILRRAIGNVVEPALAATTLANITVAGYLAMLTAAGARRPAPTPATGRHGTRFVILVPAHDEELVISHAMRGFQALDYPRDLYDVHVVADNCTDRTADIVRAHGWTVHERHAPSDPGKGPALNWLFDRVDANCEFDVAVVVDADSVVDPGFLRGLDRAFTAGADVAQGMYAVRDPESSPIAALRYAALACRHHVRALGRCRLGGSAGLYGNGMAFRRAVLRCHRWTGHLVEDAELQMELLISDGTLVTYVPSARLEAEMPDTLEAASSQNARWEAGRVDIARRYTPALARALLRSGPAPRTAYVDAIADLVVPPLSVVVVLQAVSVGGEAVAVALGSRRARARLVLDGLAMATTVSHVLLSLWSVRAPASVYRSLASVPRVVAWKAGLWLKAVRPRADVAWERTRRNAED